MCKEEQQQQQQYAFRLHCVFVLQEQFKKILSLAIHSTLALLCPGGSGLLATLSLLPRHSTRSPPPIPGPLACQGAKNMVFGYTKGTGP